MGRQKTALITGITGQDGSYLAEFLLRKRYHVHGVIRRAGSPNTARIDGILLVKLHLGNLLDQSSLVEILRSTRPDEVYNLAAMSFVQASWRQPILTTEVNSLGVLRLLEAIRQVNPEIRFYQASSSEMFGKVDGHSRQSESTPFHPRSPYGVSKTFGHYIAVNYRESYGMFTASGILFNHESPRRGIEFVTRKVSDGVARIKLGQETTLRLGNLSARRDWGFAGDYVKAMWLMLQQDVPDDYVIATGVSHSVLDLVQTAFEHVGLDWRRHVRIAKEHRRRAEVDFLCGDASKAGTRLKWTPRIDFVTLVRMMVDADMRLRRSRVVSPW